MIKKSVAEKFGFDCGCVADDEKYDKILKTQKNIKTSSQLFSLGVLGLVLGKLLSVIFKSK